jgi:hypothetical protein
MENSSLRPVRMIGAFLLGLCGCSPRAADIAFTLRSPTITLNEPIHLELEVRNNSKEAITVDLGHDRKSALVVGIETPDGQAVEATPPSAEGLGRIGRVRLEPHSQHKQIYVLNEWYSFRTVGAYSIRAKLGAPVLAESGGVVLSDVPAVKLSLTVEPRDPKRLSEICQALLSKLRETSDREQIADASLSMSYVEDPIAVPFIKQGLGDGKLMWQYAIPGLARIGNDEAVDLLIEIMKRGDNETGAALARFHLQALMQKASPDVRDRIAKSLGP